MKRYLVETNEDEHYTDDEMIDLINKAARSRNQIDYAIAQEAMYDVLNVGDKIVKEESDGRMYPYILESKSNYYNNNRMEWSARLSRDLAYETDGYVKTCWMLDELIYAIQNSRKWYLDLQ